MYASLNLIVATLDSGLSSVRHLCNHDDVIKWKHFPRNWPFVRRIHRSRVNSPHKGQWRGALMFSLICVWINGWINNGEAGDLRRYRAHYDVIVMFWCHCVSQGNEFSVVLCGIRCYLNQSSVVVSRWSLRTYVLMFNNVIVVHRSMSKWHSDPT